MNVSSPDPQTPTITSARSGPLATAALLLLALVVATYANHFHNTFHFDDTYSVVNNPYIRTLEHWPAFFTDARTYSTYVTNQNYRPLLTLSFALDYRAGHGLDPFWFQLSTFCWFLVLLASMFWLFRGTLNKAMSDGRNAWVALAAVAIFAVHPAMAETVNYILQRGDVYSTLGVVLGLAIYANLPGLRRTGLYLVPPVIAIFGKEPTAVFPATLFLWIWLFDSEDSLSFAALRSLPSAVVMGPLALLVIRMQPPTYNSGAVSPLLYRISQPAVLLSYFRKFFVPLGLNIDSDRTPYDSVTNPHAVLGYLFVLLLLTAIVLCRRTRSTRPVSFGLAWFLVASLPTSWVGLAEVENDHRMFFPFVGLTLAVCWAVALWLYPSRVFRTAILSTLSVVLAVLAWGTHLRNQVWHTDESLWYDVTVKSPHNGRGLMNYGLTQMAQGRYGRALDYFQRATAYTPNYFALEINLGIVDAALGRDAEAEPHFLRAINLSPREAQTRFYYGRWLMQQGRMTEAIANERMAMDLNPGEIDANHLLLRLYSMQGDHVAVTQLAQQTLQAFPGDPEAQAWLNGTATPVPLTQRKAAAPAMLPSAAALMDQSLHFYQQGEFQHSIDAARQALGVQPGLPEAYNNIAAGNAALGRWDDAIAAAHEALRLRPDFQLARNNLAWAESKKAESAAH